MQIEKRSFGDFSAEKPLQVWYRVDQLTFFLVTFPIKTKKAPSRCLGTLS